MRGLLLSVILVFLPGLALAQVATTNLTASLGCARCHSGLISPPQPLAIPDLTDAGLRYQPAYLFDFLQNPVRVRRHLGPARMPNFHLTPPEAAALVAFLGTQQKQPAWPAHLVEALARPSKSALSELSTTDREFCLRCHTLNGMGGVLAPELNETGFRLQTNWVRQFLADPEKFGVPPGIMPGLLSSSGAEKAPTPETADKIAGISDYLFSLGASRRKQLEEKLTLNTPGKADATRGRELFINLNCTACHLHPEIAPRQNAAPDLSKEVGLARPDWLRQFLARPHAIRPAGYQPGDGSRMPNFKLSAAEVEQIIREFPVSTTPASALAAPPISAFSQAKARSLISEKLSCLGCHRLGTQGGQIGPALTDVAWRRTPSYIRDMVHDPKLHRPHTVMPKVPLSEQLENLVIAFLTVQTNQVPPTAYLSSLQVALPGPVPTGEGPVQTYRTHCALCHGVQGRGDGFNAAFLPVRPTAHADAKYMSQRPDSTLFDGISAGGAILNKSQHMPPWGSTLSPAEIKGLVQHLRTLCGCSPPAWSAK